MWCSRTIRDEWLLVDDSHDDRQIVTAARAYGDGSIEIIGECEFTGSADSDGGECD